MDHDPPRLTPEPPIVYGELSILGYNGYVPSTERSNRRNRSKFLLCQRAAPNGIKKSRHYIVKQPQATKAIQDKDLHSISYTFSRSQTIIVEYRQDENTDMFQIGRSSEDPIDFVVMDTAAANLELIQQQHQLSNNHNHNVERHHHLVENNSRFSNQLINANDLIGLSHRYQRHLAKVGDGMLQNYNGPPPVDLYDSRGRLRHYHIQQAVLMDYHQPNMQHLRMPDPYTSNHLHMNSSGGGHHHGHSSQQLNIIQQQQQLVSSPRSSNNLVASGDQYNHSSSGRHNAISKRSHATQSTISRFACRILVDRNPPYTARIYAAGFDSSKNIFLGEKATKWEQDNTIDGLTTNGVLLMHPKQKPQDQTPDDHNMIHKAKESGTRLDSGEDMSLDVKDSDNHNSKETCENEDSKNARESNETATTHDELADDQNNNSKIIGGIWREVSVDGGIYAIRESRSATRKGIRIESESNILQDGTLIDLCGATLLWRSVDGFKSSPTKKTLEEKLDLLNASRPQCPVGLNTLVIPRKPIIPNSHQHHSHRHTSHRNKEGHNSRSEEKSGHQPYVYLKCGHVQGYHDWGMTGKSNQRTCPICLSVGNVARLSMGLEPSFYVDSGPLTYAFNPCGHMASENTVKYWCNVQIPHGTHFFHSVCPFCATPLASGELGYTRLIFQDDLD